MRRKYLAVGAFGALMLLMTALAVSAIYTGGGSADTTELREYNETNETRSGNTTKADRDVISVDEPGTDLYDETEGTRNSEITEDGYSISSVDKPSTKAKIKISEGGEPTTNSWFSQNNSLVPSINTSHANSSGEVYTEGDTGDGVFASDYNNDGRVDFLGLVDFTPILFENEDEGFSVSRRFSRGIEYKSALFFDYDNDGWDELYLMSDEGSSFFENRRGEFVEREVGLEINYSSVRGASAADYDLDGCLDLFVIQAESWHEHQPDGFYDPNTTVDEDNGNPNFLFDGDCESFEDVTNESGIGSNTWSLSTSFVDFTNDGYPDIHVANDFNNDIVYINRGSEGFNRHVLPEFTNRNGMSSEVADINKDRYMDVFVTNIHHKNIDLEKGKYKNRVKGNNLLVNLGGGEFSDRASEYGVRNGTWGWAAEATDFDNNMNKDIYHATHSGYGSTTAFFKRGAYGYRRLEDSESLDGLGQPSTFGAVSIDHDNNGTMDILEAAFYPKEGREFHLYENTYIKNSWVKIDVSNRGNRTSIGTRVRVTAGDTTMYDVKNSKSDYFSQSSRRLHFGLGNRTEANVTVTFPNGQTKEYAGVQANQTLDVPYRP